MMLTILSIPIGLPLDISPAPCTYTLRYIRTRPPLMPPPPPLSSFPLPSWLPSLTLLPQSSFCACFTHLLLCPLSRCPIPLLLLYLYPPLATGYYGTVCNYHYGSHCGLRVKCSCSPCPHCQLCNGAHGQLSYAVLIESSRDSLGL